jgi:protein-tyrosine-phosphatase/tRNA A37 threonylcarbamoyladenosine synthetase subunit TsaC/SUA5/YrdC
MPLVLDWQNANQPELLLQQIVDALGQGSLVALPTESGYVVACNLQPKPIQNLTTVRSTSPLILAMTGFIDIPIWLSERSALADRLMRRLWPGATSFVLQVSDTDRSRFSDFLKEALVTNRGVHLWAPAHGMVQAILSRADFSIGLVELSGVFGETITAPEIAQRFEKELALIVDNGPIPNRPPTRMVVEESTWKIERIGVVSEKEITKAIATWIVFICTGNTCRSPMAEALAKRRLADRLNCSIEDLPLRGYNIFSAGVAAYPGDAATFDAIDAVQAFGAELTEHRSQSVSEFLVVEADYLIAMTRSHLLAVLSRYGPGGSMRFLCGLEGDLDDPIGGGPEIYRECARTILRHIDRLITECKLI